LGGIQPNQPQVAEERREGNQYLEQAEQPVLAPRATSRELEITQHSIEI
jgi:hypothetical protein